MQRSTQGPYDYYVSSGKSFHKTLRTYAYSCLIGVAFFVGWTLLPRPPETEPFQIVAASAAPIISNATTSTTTVQKPKTQQKTISNPKPPPKKTAVVPAPQPSVPTSTPTPLIPPPPAVVVTQPTQSMAPPPTTPPSLPQQQTPPPTPPPSQQPVVVKPSETKTLFSDSFATYTEGLITSEFAYWNATDATAKKSSSWELTSGSLFAKDGAAWTGVPDSGHAPDNLSSNYTGSGIFRLTTKRADFGDVKVSFDLNLHKLSVGDATPEVAWDGVHIFLRYQSQYHLYYASINRRDDTVVIKKKVPGGPSNGGTYYDLSTFNKYKVPYDKWQKISATIKNETNGSVSIELFANGKSVAKAEDTGKGGAPITAPGKVGIRADNSDLQFKNFTVNSLD